MIRFEVETDEGRVMIERNNEYDGTWRSILPIFKELLLAMGYQFSIDEQLEMVSK